MNAENKRPPDWARRLLDLRVDRAIHGMLFVNGWPEHELDDGRGEVRARAVGRFARLARIGAPPPGTVGEMTALCAKIAKDLAIDRLRKKAVEDRYCVGLCENPDEYTPLEYGVHDNRDPVDAQRELDIVADLFRGGRMPEHGVDILEGIACGCTHKEVGEDLGITDRAVEGRLRTMRKRFREELEIRGMTPIEKKARDP